MRRDYFPPHNGNWMLMAGFRGNSENDWEGQSIDMSGDGKNIAIGAPRNDDAFSTAGRVRVFRKSNDNATDWFELGTSLEGLQAGEQCGYSVSISANGETVALGAPFNDDAKQNSGVVRVYKLHQGEWAPKGQFLHGQGRDDRAGVSVSLSDDGEVLAFGVPNADIGPDNDNSGTVMIYEFSSDGSGATPFGQWVAKGSPIEGVAANDHTGNSIVLGRYGGVLAVASTQTGTDSSLNGTVRIYKWDDTVDPPAWKRRGEPVRGKFHNDDFGRAIAMDLLGDTVAVGAPKNGENGTRSGMTRVFHWNNDPEESGGQRWEKMGHDLAGAEVDVESGHAVALSDDGLTVAVGAPFHNTNNRTEAGIVRIFQYKENNWHRTVTISGQGQYHTAGYSVALSGSGHSVAIGELMVKPHEPGSELSHIGSNLPGQVLIYGLAKPCFYDDLIAADAGSTARTGGT